MLLYKTKESLQKAKYELCVKVSLTLLDETGKESKAGNIGSLGNLAKLGNIAHWVEGLL